MAINILKPGNLSHRSATFDYCCLTGVYEADFKPYEVALLLHLLILYQIFLSSVETKDILPTTRPDKHGRVFFYFVKSELSIVPYCTRETVHWTSHFFQGTRKKRPCKTGHAVPEESDVGKEEDGAGAVHEGQQEYKDEQDRRPLRSSYLNIDIELSILA